MHIRTTAFILLASTSIVPKRTNIVLIYVSNLSLQFLFDCIDCSSPVISTEAYAANTCIPNPSSDSNSGSIIYACDCKTTSLFFQRCCVLKHLVIPLMCRYRTTFCHEFLKCKIHCIVFNLSLLVFCFCHDMSVKKIYTFNNPTCDSSGLTGQLPMENLDTCSGVISGD